MYSAYHDPIPIHRHSLPQFRDKGGVAPGKQDLIANHVYFWVQGELISPEHTNKQIR